MVAVGFNPRTNPGIGPRRGATLEAECIPGEGGTGSGVAPRRGSRVTPIRGLKPTATAIKSLRDCKKLSRAQCVSELKSWLDNP